MQLTLPPTVGTQTPVDTTTNDTMSNSTVSVESTTAPIIVTTLVGQASTDNIALIGGIVGGVLALLLIVGLIALFATRRRQDNSAKSPHQGVDMASARTSTSASSNYGKINNQQTNYNASFLKMPRDEYEIGMIDQK